MSDILADIDDTLADWHGSKDSMRWAPDGEPQQLTSASFVHPHLLGPVLQAAHRFSAAMMELTTSTGIDRADIDETASFLQLINPWSLEMTLPLAEPTMGQTYWQIQAARRPIAAAFRVSLADLGMPSRYGFDARYRQRQKNRRKRRR